MRKKPTIEEIKTEFELCKKKYSAVQGIFAEDEKFYDLDFKSRIKVSKQFNNDRVVLPTARDIVDVAVNHTDINNARVFANKKGTSDIADESAEMLRKFGLGVIHATNVNSRIAPGHQGAKHYWIHGLGVFKTIWAANKWVDKPPRGDKESDETYAKRMDEWRAEYNLSLPIIIQAVNPSCIMPDPYTGGDYYIFEWHQRKLFDAKRIWPHFKNPNNIPSDEEVECISYWDDKYRCELVDGVPVLRIRGGVVEHKYGFNPYTLIESGLGNLSKDAKPEDKYVGLIRHVKDTLVSESTNYTLHNIHMKRETLKGGYITGADAGDYEEVKQEYGVFTPVGNKDVVFHDWEVKIPPEASSRHLAVTHDYIASHAAPRSVRGMAEAGVRSGADRRLVIAEAAAIYQYASPAFARGWANILSKCAMLVKNVIPGDFDIWARTPSDEFDIPIKKSLFREPFNFYVEFSPISEEDEYRRHDDLLRLSHPQMGVVTKKWARRQMSNVDPIAMDKEEQKELLRNDPNYTAIKSQYLSYKLQEALGVGQPPVEGTEGAPQGEFQGRLVPPSPERASPAEQQRRQYKPPIVGQQGQGGGGIR